MAERKSWIERGAEFSKKVDKYGIGVGLGMMAIGIIYAPLFIPGVVVAGGSAVTNVIAEEIRKGAHRKRLQTQPAAA